MTYDDDELEKDGVPALLDLEDSEELEDESEDDEVEAEVEDDLE